MNAVQAMETLRGGLWHTTSEACYEGILSSQAILAEPPIPESERSRTRCGPSGWPYVRTLGGVSLFDFDGFDVQAYESKFQSSSWQNFVPFQHSLGAAVWIEIDRNGARENLMTGCEVLQKRQKDKAFRHELMPCIEACYLGNIPKDLFMRVLAIRKGDAAFRSIAD